MYSLLLHVCNISSIILPLSLQYYYKTSSDKFIRYYFIKKILLQPEIFIKINIKKYLPLIKLHRIKRWFGKY